MKKYVVSLVVLLTVQVSAQDTYNFYFQKNNSAGKVNVNPQTGPTNPNYLSPNDSNVYHPNGYRNEYYDDYATPDRRRGYSVGAMAPRGIYQAKKTEGSELKLFLGSGKQTGYGITRDPEVLVGSVAMDIPLTSDTAFHVEGAGSVFAVGLTYDLFESIGSTGLDFEIGGGFATDMSTNDDSFSYQTRCVSYPESDNNNCYNQSNFDDYDEVGGSYLHLRASIDLGDAFGIYVDSKSFSSGHSSRNTGVVFSF
ncbi:MAG: hypothetical protein AB8E15_08330 [Bdellovibrionales bacterium]